MSIRVDLLPGALMGQYVRIGQHHLCADLPRDEGGGDLGPSPHDLYDAALGACKALSILWFARRRGIPVEDVSVVVDRDAAHEHEGKYRLHSVLDVSGPLTTAQREELAYEAARCPIQRLMTEVDTEITTELSLGGGA